MDILNATFISFLYSIITKFFFLALYCLFALQAAQIIK